jgi:signal transduction histidine kinase
LHPFDDGLGCHAELVVVHPSAAIGDGFEVPSGRSELAGARQSMRGKPWERLIPADEHRWFRGLMPALPRSRDTPRVAETRRRWLDPVLAGIVTLGCTSEVWAPGGFGSTNAVGPRWAVFAAYLVGSVALLVRRSHAFAAALATYGALALEWLVFGSSEGFGVFFLLLLPAYAVAAHEDRPRALMGLGAAVAAGAVWVLRDPANTTLGTHAQSAAWLGPVVIAWLSGAYTRTRRLYVSGLHERAEAAEREKEDRAVAATVAERSRIARELHDIVAHSVSVMVVQAQVVEEMLERGRPDRAEVPARKIQDTGRAALADLRRLLGVMRDADAETTLSPQPGIANLDLLLHQVRESGLPVDLTVQGRPVSLPPAVDLSAYRIVQEALTNSLKHAGGARAHVVVRFTSQAVELDVSDDGPGVSVAAGDAALPPGGHGLVGMRERVAMYGGLLEAGQAPSGGYLVHATLPLAEAPG